MLSAILMPYFKLHCKYIVAKYLRALLHGFQNVLGLVFCNVGSAKAEHQMVSKMTDFYCHLTILGKRRGVSKKKYSFQRRVRASSIGLTRRTQSLSRENPMKSKEEEGEKWDGDIAKRSHFLNWPRQILSDNPEQS